MICFLNSSRTVKTCCQTTSYFSKMAHRPIRLASLKNGSSSIVGVRQEGWVATKLTWPKSSSTTTSVKALCLSRYKVFTPKPTNKAELKTAGGHLERLATSGYRPDCASVPGGRAIGVHSSWWWSHFETPTQIESVSSTNGPFSGPKKFIKK